MSFSIVRPLEFLVLGNTCNLVNLLDKREDLRMKDIEKITYKQILKSIKLRGDHYDGMNGLYRFSAVTSIDNLMAKNSSKEEIDRFIAELRTWPVIPNEVVIFIDRIELHWYPKGFQMVMSKIQYLKLIYQFVSYLHDLPKQNIHFLNRCLIEDPDRRVWGLPVDRVNCSPRFNSQDFGLEEEECIRVILLNEKLEGAA